MAPPSVSLLPLLPLLLLLVVALTTSGPLSVHAKTVALRLPGPGRYESTVIAPADSLAAPVTPVLTR